jgi:hypothetical protein
MHGLLQVCACAIAPASSLVQRAAENHPERSQAFGSGTQQQLSSTCGSLGAPAPSFEAVSSRERSPPRGAVSSRTGPVVAGVPSWGGLHVPTLKLRLHQALLVPGACVRLAVCDCVRMLSVIGVCESVFMLLRWWCVCSES